MIARLRSLWNRPLDDRLLRRLQPLVVAGVVVALVVVALAGGGSENRGDDRPRRATAPPPPPVAKPSVAARPSSGASLKPAEGATSTAQKR